MATKINWQQAYEWFIQDATRSYAEVAKHFKVTKQSVERKAIVILDDGSSVTWAKRRQMLGEIAKKQSEDEYRRTVPARTEQHLMQYRNLQIIISTKISYIAGQNRIYETDSSELLSLAKALKLAIDGERVILGLTTSVAAVKPDTDDSKYGWGELLALAVRTAKESDQ